jgi:hypothetical protein
MALAEETLRAIKANAAMVIEQMGPLSDVAFGLNEASVAWVEGFIERRRATNPDGDLTSVLGSFLGEAIIAAAGGVWDECDNGVGVRFSEGNWAFPFAKVAKQYANGLEGGDSILSFYQITVSDLAKGKLGG